MRVQLIECCSASSHRLTMGSQRNTLTHRWNAHSLYKIWHMLCEQHLVVLLGWGRPKFLFAGAGNEFLMDPQRPAPSISKAFAIQSSVWDQYLRLLVD